MLLPFCCQIVRFTGSTEPAVALDRPAISLGTGNRDAISLPWSLGSTLQLIRIASRFPLPRPGFRSPKQAKIAEVTNWAEGWLMAGEM